jgi:uncharacterized protein (DUF697 family)
MTPADATVSAATPARAGAMRIVQRYVAVSAVAGLNPVPVLDVTVLGGVHVALIKELSNYYGAEFSEHTARNIVIAVAASLIPGSIGTVLGRKALRALPFITHGAGMLVMSAASAGVSYALGKLFIHHFESGGTLDSFDAKRLHQILPRTTLA